MITKRSYSFALRSLKVLTLLLLCQPASLYSQDANLEAFNLYRDAGFDLEDKSQFDSAIVLYHQAKTLSEYVGNDYWLTTIYTDLAIAYRKRSDYVHCQEYHKKALEIALKTQDQEIIEDSYHGLGTLYEVIGSYDLAVEYYLKALELSLARHDSEGATITYQGISKAYMKLNFEDLAMQNISSALKYSDEMGNDSLKANVLHDYGEVLLHFGKHQDALNKLDSALQTYERINYPRFIASSLVYIGDVYSKLGDNDKTLLYFKRALTYKEHMEPYVFADLHLKLGDLLLLKNEKNEALKILHICFKEASEDNFRDIQQKSAESLYKIYKSQGDIIKANQYLFTDYALKDSLFSVSKTTRVAEMQLKYSNEKQMHLVHQLQLEQNRILTGVGSFVMLLIIGFLSWLWNNGKKRNQLLTERNLRIKRQNHQLTESNEILRQYAYVAAHDLKEPLRTISTFVKLLEVKFGNELSDKQSSSYIKFISDSAKRMNLLLNDLLEYSSVFRQEPGTEVVDANEVLDEVEHSLTALIQLKSAQLKKRQTLPKILINKNHLLQIFQNLISNALKFSSPERKPIVEIGYHLEGQLCLFSIKDNGVGINERHKEKLFQLFYRCHNSTEVEGSGIGLSICKSLISKYGGDITFESTEGIGTTFYLSFPLEMITHQKSLELEMAS